jgi:hypothetical protein
MAGVAGGNPRENLELASGGRTQSLCFIAWLDRVAARDIPTPIISVL